MGIILSLNSIILRSNESLFKQKFNDLKFVLLAFVISFVVLLPVTYIPEFSKVFNMNVYVNSFNNWIFALPFIFGLVPTFFIEFIKLIKLFVNKKLKVN
ncbi:cation transporting ATPase C-terminal domain-containing protein [Mycoplasma sp. AC157]